jgi:hypothetical protein
MKILSPPRDVPEAGLLVDLQFAASSRTLATQIALACRRSTSTRQRGIMQQVEVPVKEVPESSDDTALSRAVPRSSKRAARSPGSIVLSGLLTP